MDWKQPLGAVKSRVAAQLHALSVAVMVFWEAQRKWLKTWYVKLLAVTSIALAILTAATNIWGVSALNRDVLPSAVVAVSQSLDREVCAVTYNAILHKMMT